MKDLEALSNKAIFRIIISPSSRTLIDILSKAPCNLKDLREIYRQAREGITTSFGQVTTGLSQLYKHRIISIEEITDQEDQESDSKNTDLEVSLRRPEFGNYPAKVMDQFSPSGTPPYKLFRFLIYLLDNPKTPRQIKTDWNKKVDPSTIKKSWPNWIDHKKYGPYVLSDQGAIDTRTVKEFLESIAKYNISEHNLNPMSTELSERVDRILKST
jgi:hypothetical protein